MSPGPAPMAAAEAASAEHPAAAALSALRLHSGFLSRAEALKGRRDRPRRTEPVAFAFLIAAERWSTFLRRPELLHIARVAIGHCGAMARIVPPDIACRLVIGMIPIVAAAIDPDVMVAPVEIAPSPIGEWKEYSRVPADKRIARAAIPVPRRVVIRPGDRIGPRAVSAPRIVLRHIDHIGRRR